MELSGWKLALLVFAGYWLVCRFLRWRRAQHIANRFKGRDPYSLTIEEAQWVHQQIFCLEMSKISRFATAFALFRTYGIPSIAQILVKTAQLKDPKLGGKRYVDTGVAITDFVNFPFDSERHAEAMARTNWLHSHYNISNDDKLYTLSVFVTCPARWLEKYDWRPLSQLEIASMYIIWREIGYQMKIENVPKTYEEMRDWADDYEARNMVPNKMNHELAELTLALLTYYTPKTFKPFMMQILIGLMDDRLRSAMLYPPPHPFVGPFIKYSFAFRRFLLRNFFLPRTKPIHYTSREKNVHGRYNTTYADNEPWYLPKDKRSFIARWINSLQGRPNPCPEYMMDGYTFLELGPTQFVGKGKDAMDKEVVELRKRGELLKKTGSSGGCPLSFN